MTPRRLLLTGFEPFGGDGFNPSGTLAAQLQGRVLPGGAEIEELVLPVSGPAAWRKMSRAIRRLQPHWIIATGVSGRAELSIESTAWNEADYRIPDNAGLQPQSARILARGPVRLDSGLGVAVGFSAGGLLPVRPSADPGRYVCNYLYYRLLHLTRTSSHSACGRAVFLHLPATPEMKRGPQDARFFHPLAGVRDTLLSLLELVAASGQLNG
jgi:pyroglutamyl-peptidase